MRKQEIETNPIHKHDCESCIFLGDYDDGNYDYDLYFCPNGGVSGNSIIARYGENEKYMSGTNFAVSSLFEGDLENPLVIALIEAYHQKLITVKIENNE